MIVLLVFSTISTLEILTLLSPIIVVTSPILPGSSGSEIQRVVLYFFSLIGLRFSRYCQYLLIAALAFPVFVLLSQCNDGDTFFDVIISSQSIEHLKDDRKFLEGVRRTLKIGGTFICTTPNKLSLIPEGEKPYDTPFYPFHVREYMPDQFFGLLQEYFGNIKKMSLINPNRDPEVAKNYRVKLIYRASRFRIIRWLGRMLSQKAKKSLYLFGNENLKSILKDTGTEYVNYSDAMVPECLCGICVKTSS